MPRPVLEEPRSPLKDEPYKPKLTPAQQARIDARNEKIANLNKGAQRVLEQPGRVNPHIKRYQGRPTKYDANLSPTMAHQLALLGADDKDMAAAFGISIQTFNSWKKYPEFMEAIQDGKSRADAKVALSMYGRATGYNYPEEQIFYDRDTGEVIRVETTKHVPPDVTAGFSWLRLRQRKNWDSINKVELTGSDGAPLIPPVIKLLPVKVISKDD